MPNHSELMEMTEAIVMLCKCTAPHWSMFLIWFQRHFKVYSFNKLLDCLLVHLCQRIMIGKIGFTLFICTAWSYFIFMEIYVYNAWEFAQLHAFCCLLLSLASSSWLIDVPDIYNFKDQMQKYGHIKVKQLLYFEPYSGH